MEVTDEEIRQVISSCKIKIRYNLADNKCDICRELAKRPEIQLKWSLAKASSTPFFSNPVVEWNPLQQRLAHWLKFYNSVNQAYDRPPDRVIQNDSLLGQWLEMKSREAEAEAEKNWQKGSSGVKKSAYDHDEVYELGY